MSLLVWLPLNGNLNNQGLSNYNLSMFRGTEVYNNAGKIGKCFYANGVNTIKILNIIPDFYNYSEYSLCAWFYIEAQNPSHSGSAIISGGNWNNQLLNLALSDWSTDHYTRLQVSGTSWNKVYNYNFMKNTWYHVVVCSDSNHTYAYVNGILIGDTIASFLPTNIEGNDICIGGATYYGGMQFFGKINDVRIYNHCLSKKEIEELSKGLVGHYKLDDNNIESTINYAPQPYQATYPAINSSWDASKHSNAVNIANWGYGYNSGVGNPTQGYHAMWNIIDGIPTIVFQNHNSEIGAQNRWMGTSSTTISISIPAGTKYTISYEQRTMDVLGSYTTSGLYYKTTSSSSNSFHDGCNVIGSNTKIGVWERFSRTYTRSSAVDGTGTNGTIYIYAHYSPESTIQVRNIQLEVKDHMTAYTRNSRNDTIVYDSSGYNYNGIINGSFNISNNTARYSNSFIFNGSDNAIKIPFNDMMGSTPIDYTVSVWIYKTSIGTKGYQTILGGPSGFELEARNGGGTDPQFVGWNWGKPVASYVFNEWTLFTFVRTASDCKIYVNGEYQSAGSTGTVPVGNYFIGAWSNATAQNYEGQMSDFRIYTTALTADQIKELYNTSATIDKAGNIYAREVIE